jgi:hypothetical protein
LPFTPKFLNYIPTGWLRDTGTGDTQGVLLFNTDGKVHSRVSQVSGSYVTYGSLNSSTPFTWGNTDQMVLCGYYEV